jgi:hypothetical protein
MPGLLLLFAAPEQRRDFIPRMGLSRPEREIGKEPLGLLRGKDQGWTRREAGFKPSKKPECD